MHSALAENRGQTEGQGGTSDTQRRIGKESAQTSMGNTGRSPDIGGAAQS